MKEIKLRLVEKMCTPKPEKGDIPFRQFIVLQHSSTALHQYKAFEFHPLHEINEYKISFLNSNFK